MNVLLHSISNTMIMPFIYLYTQSAHFDNTKMAKWAYKGQKLTKIQGILQKSKSLNKNCNFSTFEFLHYSLYLGQFLAYTGIFKVCTLSIQIDKRHNHSIRNSMK